MNAVIIFDVGDSSRTPQIRERMRASGYFFTWIVESDNTRTLYNLPANMLWKPNCEGPQAISDLTNIVQSLGTTLDRCIVLNSTPWFGIVGIPNF